MIDEPVEQRAGGHEAAGEGPAGLHIPLARVGGGEPPQDHLLVLPLSDPCRRPGKEEGLPLRPWSRGRRGRWHTSHTQEQEERQGNGEYSLDLAHPAACHACTFLFLLTVVSHLGTWPANAITDVLRRCRFVSPSVLPP